MISWQETFAVFSQTNFIIIIIIFYLTLIRPYDTLKQLHDWLVLHVRPITDVLQTKKSSLYDWLMLSTVPENVPSCTAWTGIIKCKQIFAAGNFREFYANAKFAKVSCSRNFPVLQYFPWICIVGFCLWQVQYYVRRNWNTRRWKH